MRKYLLSTTVLAIIACLLWSTAFFSIKIGLEYTSPLNFAGLRFMLSGLLIIPFCGGLNRYISIIKENYIAILKISIFQTFALYSLFYLGINLVPASITAIVIGASPLFIALMAHVVIHDDKLYLRKLLSISIGLIGIIIIAADKYNLSWVEGKEFWGLLILIAANLSGGFGNIMVAKYKKKGTALVFNSAQIFLGGYGIFILSLFLENDMNTTYTLPYFITLIWLGIVSALAFSIWFVLLQRSSVKVSEVNIWKFLIPVFGAVLSWIIIPTEKPELIPIVGMVIITFSLILLNLNRVNISVKRK